MPVPIQTLVLIPNNVPPYEPELSTYRHIIREVPYLLFPAIRRQTFSNTSSMVDVEMKHWETITLSEALHERGLLDKIPEADISELTIKWTTRGINFELIRMNKEWEDEEKTSLIVNWCNIAAESTLYRGEIKTSLEWIDIDRRVWSGELTLMIEDDIIGR